MATFVKTPAGTCKGILRKRGWPTTIKTFRTKRDATNWARRAEDEMVRGHSAPCVVGTRASARGAGSRAWRTPARVRQAEAVSG